MEEQGYDVRRFEGEVRQDLLCSFCLNVPEDARQCVSHDHLFCFAHISQYLRDREACPTCREHLTPETLRRPTGFIKNYLDDLMIDCEYHGRGCPEHVRLESLQNHVDQCGFAPITCGNEECGMEINTRDKESHEKDLCHFRIVKYRDIKAVQEEIMEKQNVILQELSEVIASQDEIRNIRDAMKESEDEMKANQDGIKASQKKVERRQDRMNKGLKKMKENISGIKRKLDEIDDTVKKMKDKVDKIQVDMQAKMNQQLIVMAGLVNQIKTPAVNQEIIIMGGFGDSSHDEYDNYLNTVEIYNLGDGTSVQLPAMGTNRAASASCVYNNDVVIVGGMSNQGSVGTIEVLKLNQFPQRWMNFENRLSVNLSHFDVVVHGDKLFVIGGWILREGTASNAIYEVSLTPPYTCKLLFTMPQPRYSHKAALVNGKLFILGGSTTNYARDSTDSVISYNFKNNNEYKEHAALPRPLSGMSTVTWGNMIIVIGGTDRNNAYLNEVFTYDTETGQTRPLPRMMDKKTDCSAVIIDNEIFVMGGSNDEGARLDSIESLKIGSDGWKRLAGMQQKQSYATAVVKPQT